MNTSFLYILAAAFPLIAPALPALGVLAGLIYLAKRIEQHYTVAGGVA